MQQAYVSMLKKAMKLHTNMQKGCAIKIAPLLQWVGQNNTRQGDMATLPTSLYDYKG
jgi:hypothetical protein